MELLSTERYIVCEYSMDCENCLWGMSLSCVDAEE